MGLERWFYKAPLFFRTLFRRGRVERELAAELLYHMEQRIARDIERGVAPAEARRAARLAMDGIECPKEECRDMRSTRFLEQFFQDLRYGGRSLLRSPGFAVVTLLSLALGIGANTAIFSLMDKVLFESLPVDRPRELMLLNPDGLRNGWSEGPTTWSYPAYAGLSAGQRVFSGLLAERSDVVNLSTGGAAERANQSIVSGNYFQVLGVKPMLGRLITPDDDRTRGGHPVAVISHGFWVEHFGSRPDVVGETIRLNRHPFTVIGVTEPRFNGLEIGDTVDVFVPAAMLAVVATYGGALDNRTAYIFQVYGRLLPGVSREQARAQLQPLYLAQLEQDVQAMGGRITGDGWKKGRVLLEDGYRGTSWLRVNFEMPLKALMAMTGLVLLIACANIAGLLMARAASRTREMSIRLAIGASRGRIVRQLLAESTLLAAAGGFASLLVASWTVRALVAQLGEGSGRLQLVANFLDGRVLGFAFLVSLVTGVVFGLLPAFAASRTSVASSLKGGIAADRGGTVRLRRVLVTAQLALGLVLVTASGLFLRTLGNLRNTDTGFRTDRLVQFRLNSGVAGYDRARSTALFQSILEELRALPGVESATLAVSPLLSNSMIRFSLNVEGYTPAEGESRSSNANVVSPGYFKMLGMPVVRGRDFRETDTSSAPRVAIVNESFVNKYFPGRDPLGKTFSLGYGGAQRYTYEIVGVSRDARLTNLRNAPWRNFFFPYTQFDVLNASYFYVRYRGQPDLVAGAIRGVVKRHDPDIPVVNYRTVEEQIDQLLQSERLVASLSLAFGVLATGLAAIGLYGVTAFSVTRRTREIGIRMALGAKRGTVQRMILRDVAVMAAAGIAVGTGLSLALARYVETQLYGVAPRDLMTLAGAAALLGAVALLSGWLPARRATRVDTTLALRQE